MKEKREGASPLEKLLGPLQLPDDFVRGNVLVSMHGQERIWIENFKGIASFGPEEIRLTARNSSLRITGKRLEIVYYTKDEMEIAGWIQEVSFCRAQ